MAGKLPNFHTGIYIVKTPTWAAQVCITKLISLYHHCRWDLIYFCQSINKKVSFRSDHFYDSISRAIIYSKNDLQAKSELGGSRKLLLPLTFLAIYKKRSSLKLSNWWSLFVGFPMHIIFKKRRGTDNCNGNLINFLDAPRKKCDYF